MPSLPWRIGHVVHALREASGWNAKELATLAKMDATQIYRLESGMVKNPKDETLAKIAGVFGVTVKELRNAVPDEPIVFDKPLRTKPKPGATVEMAPGVQVETVRKVAQPRPSHVPPRAGRGKETDQPA